MNGFSEIIADINDAVNNVVWGIPMVILILATGIYMTVRTGFFQIVKAKFVINETFLAIFKKRSVTKSSSKKALSQFQALSTALAATIGVGNIAGVSGAILTGGPGAVFWMWISALFGMMTKYSENVLGIFYRQKNSDGEWSGGPMYYLKNGLGSKKGCKEIGKILAVLFAVFCVLASFGIGNMTQVNEISRALNGAFNIPLWATGIVIALATGLVILGGMKRIGRVTEKVVPLMAVIYILGTVFIMISNVQRIPEVFLSIVKGAFGVKAVGGAAVGLFIKNTVATGFKRGIFSNEAGLGSSVMVNSSSDVKEPVIQGMWGIFEVFFDTIVVCSLTAFTVLSSGLIDLETGKAFTSAEGASLVSEAFKTGIHEFAGGFIAIIITLFAFSTILGWSFYGTKSVEYLFGTKVTIIYKCIFIAILVVGATMKLELVWGIADTLNGLMAIPNLIGVLSLSGLVVKITQNYVKRKISKDPENIAPILSNDEKIQAEYESQV